MAKKEIRTDLWVYDLLKESGIRLDAQGSCVKELDNALKNASKRGTGNVGFPEYCGIVQKFVLVIEDKADLSKHIKYDENDTIDMSVNAVIDYAVNGAIFYAKHLIKNTTYKQIFAFGVSGDSKHHRITPIYIDDKLNVKILDDVESFISFTADNIDEYYLRDVLNEVTDEEKELAEILKDASDLHKHLRNYGNMKDEEKPLVVSGILLALREREKGNFRIDDLTGDTVLSDGQKIYNAIESNLNRTNVSPATKKDKILSQFRMIKDSPKLNEINATLGETPLKFFAKYLDERLYKPIIYAKSSEDYLGRFYGEFMSYSGGSGQTLGIILTPKHITELFCDLVDLKSDDRVLDPCCGTGGFLVASMHKMLKKATSKSDEINIRQNQLLGIEQRSDMFTIATTNMILRGDGKSNLECSDFLSYNPYDLQKRGATVGMMNPPYSQGSSTNSDLYEISFVEHLLDSIVDGGRIAVIVPQSTFCGKTTIEQQIKNSIYKKHTLEGVISLNKNTFYGVGTVPCIAIFTAGIPHSKEKICKFINFEDDGYKVAMHVGLIETESAKDKKQHLLDVWFDKVDSESKFCVKTTVEPEDEWLHSFYYYNDEQPSEFDIENVVSNYLLFEYNMILQNKEKLFEDGESND